MKKLTLLLTITLLTITSVFSKGIRDIKIENYKLSSDATETVLKNLKKEKTNNNSYSYYDGENWLYKTNVDLYFLGWSKDGKIAYFEDYPVEGRGGKDFIMKIVDLVTDEVVWDYCEKNYDEDEKNEKFALLKCIQKNSEKIDKALNENKIVLSVCKYESLPIKSSSKEISINVNILKKEKGMYENTISYEIEAVNNKNQKKIISKENNRAVNMLVPTGYFKSPYENRAAVVLIGSKYVFEGSELFAEFYGCALNIGFSKK